MVCQLRIVIDLYSREVMIRFRRLAVRARPTAAGADFYWQAH